MNAAYGSSVTLPVSNWTRLLLLAVICCYSLASTTGGFYDEGSSSWSNYDEMWQGDSENATDVDSENATDVTELCRAIIDTNSSNAINSSTNSTTDGNYSEFFSFLFFHFPSPPPLFFFIATPLARYLAMEVNELQQYMASLFLLLEGRLETGHMLMVIPLIEWYSMRIPTHGFQ